MDDQLPETGSPVQGYPIPVLQAGIMLGRIEECFYQKIGEHDSNADKTDRNHDPVLWRDHKGQICMVGQHKIIICRKVL